MSHEDAKTKKAEKKIDEDKKLDAEIDKAEKEFFEREKREKEAHKKAEKEVKKESAPPKEASKETAKEAPKAALPKEPAPEVPKFEVTEFNPWNVLKYPHLTEKSMNMVELENKLVFVADRRAKKSQIKEAIEKGFNVKIDNLNVVITQKGLKKVYAKLGPESDAVDIASRLGML
ncbi:MAG: 50S ribosomal protein L23 [Candidatus Aenigmatarchaeota archaeon]|nr:50S ribosomal protein L23 [Nanoarchaeota archaeon]